MMKEFKEFMLKGNVIDLAVGLVIGSAFTAMIKGAVEAIITPLVTLTILLATGNKDTSFKGLNVAFNGVVFEFGTLISIVLTFLLTGLVLFLFVKSINKIRALTGTEKEEAEQKEIDYLKEIRDLLAEKEKKR